MKASPKIMGIIVNLKINETIQNGAVRKPQLPFFRWVGTVSNCADAVANRTYRGRKCLFIFRIHHIYNSDIINMINRFKSYRTSCLSEDCGAIG